MLRSPGRLALLALSLLALACGREAAPDESAFRKAQGNEGVGAVAMTAEARADAPAPASAVAPPPSPSRGTQDSSVSMVIRNGSASIKVDSLEPAIAALRALAGRMGGSIGNLSVAGGEHQIRSANVELRVPSARFDEAISSLSPIGKVESSQATAEDVGEEYVDLSARVANSRRLEERLITLLATRTGKLEDVLAVERELARVREEVERVEGRMRYLRTRVAMSTLSVYVHEPEPLVGQDPGTGAIAQAFRDMWRNFVQFIALVISSLGVVVPLGAIAAAAAYWWRRRNRHPSP